MPDQINAGTPDAATPPRSAEWQDSEQRCARAMWALVDWLKPQGLGFAAWPDHVKHAFSEAIIDKRPPTEREIQRTHELAERFGWKRAAVSPAPAPPEEPQT